MEQKIKEALDYLNPSEERKTQMLAAIERQSSASHRPSAHGKLFSRTMRLVAAACAALAVLGISTLGINAATGGAVTETIRNLFGRNTSTEDVISETKLDIFRNMIFAPEIIYIDDAEFIFVTDRAIITYDRAADAVSQTIDTQQTDCIYWDTDAAEIHSHALYDNGNIWLFNEKSGTRYGSVYCYTQENGEERRDDPALWQEIYDKWLIVESRYVDTFARFESIGLGEAGRHPNEQLFYSHRSYPWTDAGGHDLLSYLTVPTDEKGVPTAQQFILNCFDTHTNMTTETLLALWDTDTSAEELQSEYTLPPFAYTGDDPVIAAICEAEMNEQKDYYHSEDSVWIPGYVIYDRVEKDGSLYVFGNFWGFSYYRNGNTLMCESGGSSPARVELQEEADGTYRVIELIRAMDGADYERSIREFTEGFFGVYGHFFDGIFTGTQEQKRENVRKEFIRMYVTSNDLDIEYYKDYGWEPVPIFSE